MRGCMEPRATTDKALRTYTGTLTHLMPCFSGSGGYHREWGTQKYYSSYRYISTRVFKIDIVSKRG